ncbi:hypothetical protein GOODEAATRI_031432 [Goodea atripinnis]|uniref:Uncharacterized protein n=1 Tax=Goodea atripinnis TaxID=208336 RepID=A0ABV0PIJ4_9TELE
MLKKQTTSPECGRNRKLSAAANRFLRRHVVKAPQLAGKGLQQDLQAAATNLHSKAQTKQWRAPHLSSKTDSTTEPKAQNSDVLNWNLKHMQKTTPCKHGGG